MIRTPNRRSRALPLALVALGLLQAGPASQPSAAALQEASTQDRGLTPSMKERITAEVRAFTGQYIRALEAGEEEEILALFVADGRFAWFTDGVKSYASPADVLAGLKMYAGTTFRTTLSEVEVVPLRADLASVRSPFRTQLTIPNSEPQAFSGVITWLVEKDGASKAWKVLLGHTSTPSGPPRDSSSEQDSDRTPDK